VKRQYDNKDGRLRGRALQERRLRVWSKNPHCAGCGKLCAYPSGFELDHRIALANGGKDAEENCQVLCIGPLSCHEKKTAKDLGTKIAVKIGLDGFPIEG